jgi:hypothetical protein
MGEGDRTAAGWFVVHTTNILLNGKKIAAVLTDVFYNATLQIKARCSSFLEK